MPDDHYTARQASSGLRYIHTRTGSIRVNFQNGHLIFGDADQCRDFAKALSLARRVREDEEKRQVWADIVNGDGI